MPLESVTYISDLVATNPVGATDPKSQGDDHIRAIKSALLTTLPGLTGAMTATHTQLNQLASLAAVSVLGRAANSSGAPAAIAAGANDRLLIRTSDALSFGQLTAGMFPSTVVPDAALSSNVPLLNAANVFTSAASGLTGFPLTASSATPGILIRETGAGATEQYWRNFASAAVLAFDVHDGTSTANPWMRVLRSGATPIEIEFNATLLDFNGAADFSSTVAVNGFLTVQGADNRLFFVETDATADEGKWTIRANSDALSFTAINDALNAETSWFGVSGRTGTTVDTAYLSASTLDLNGALSPDTSSAASVGYLGTPQNAQNGDYTLVIGDMGKTIYKASGGAGETITIPANASVAFPVGTIVRVANNGGGTLSIAITTDTLSLAGAGTTGTRTLADHGVAILEKVASTEWFISGVGVS